MQIALLQTTSSDSPEDNLAMLQSMIRDAAAQGAGFVLTPEVSLCLSASRRHQQEVLKREDDDPHLKALQAEAKAQSIWLHIGSMAVKTEDPDGRFANRSLLINPQGEITARYDKIHMFDVTISETESYRESAGYRPGAQAVIAKTPFASLGLSICYDLRFAYLYRALAQAGADVLLVPAAFSSLTGPAHWEPLLRARAIETGSFVIAAAQTGTHNAGQGALRETHGHSMVISPWGEVLLDAGKEPGIYTCEIDREESAKARHKIAALTHDRDFDLNEQ